MNDANRVFAKFIGWKNIKTITLRGVTRALGDRPSGAQGDDCKAVLDRRRELPDFFGLDADAQIGIKALAQRNFIIVIRYNPRTKKWTFQCDFDIKGSSKTLHKAFQEAVMDCVPDCNDAALMRCAEDRKHGAGHECKDCMSGNWRVKPALKAAVKGNRMHRDNKITLKCPTCGASVVLPENLKDKGAGEYVGECEVCKTRFDLYLDGREWNEMPDVKGGKATFHDSEITAEGFHFDNKRAEENLEWLREQEKGKT